MADENHYTGAILIDPPLTWPEIQSGPSVRDVALRVWELSRTSEDGLSEIVTRGADAVIPACDGFGGRRFEEDLQAIVDHYGERRTFRGHIEVEWDPGYGITPPSRFLVRDGRVIEVEATLSITWPDDEAGWPSASLVSSLRLTIPAAAVDQTVHAPGRVAAYLASRGFVQVWDDDRLTAWVPPGDAELRARWAMDAVDGRWAFIIPAMPHTDYRARIGKLVQFLAAEDETGELAILTAIANQPEGGE
jgi:Family of unknown function (DUF6205)